MLEIDAGHVLGGWSGHVYLKVSENRANQLRRVAEICRDEIINNKGLALGLEKVQIVEDFHITLTRPFYLQHHQISGFVAELERQMAGTGASAVGFKPALATYLNERRDRTFVALDVDQGREYVQEVLDTVDRVMDKFGQRQFFSHPQFHVSLVMVDKGIERKGRIRLGDEALLIQSMSAADVHSLACIFGNQQYEINL